MSLRDIGGIVLDASIGGMIILGFGVKGDDAICMNVALVLRWMCRMWNDDGSEFVVVCDGFGSVRGGSAGE